MYIKAFYKPLGNIKTKLTVIHHQMVIMIHLKQNVDLI